MFQENYSFSERCMWVYFGYNQKNFLGKNCQKCALLKAKLEFLDTFIFP